MSREISNLDQKLDTIHSRFKTIIQTILTNGCKFEELLYLARCIIRSDYNKLTESSIEDIVKQTYNELNDINLLEGLSWP